MQTHELKVYPRFFKSILIGAKAFEIRQETGRPDGKPDRTFNVGDRLVLKECEGGVYTGRQMTVLVTYVLRDPAFGVQPGFAVLSIQAEV